jgi:hypothetical protein
MKTFLASALLTLLIASAATAQDHPYLFSGRTFVGGGFSLGFGETDPDDGDPFMRHEGRQSFGSLSPTYGRFYNDRWAAGVTLTVSHSRTSNRMVGANSLEETLGRQMSWGITPFLRRYLPLTERFGAYVQPAVSYRYSRLVSLRERTDDLQPVTNSKTEFVRRRHAGSIGAGGGLYYFITEHFTVETNLLQLTFAVDAGTDESTTQDNQVNVTTLGTNSNARLNFINQLSLDQAFIISYYF